MANVGSYEEYTRAALENFERRDDASRFALVDAVRDRNIERVLDVGCGAGQELLPFLERTKAFCVGVDAAAELGAVTKRVFEQNENANRVRFVRSMGEELPFASESFDLILCRVALPYMNNRRAIAEIARVLKPGGALLLKTHAPAFYFGMIRERLPRKSLKQIAYPLICLAGGAWHAATGNQLREGFWKGKEVFQTEGFLRRECRKNNLKITGELADTNRRTPSFVIEKF